MPPKDLGWKRFAHVSIAVPDARKAIDFHKRLFGLTEHDNWFASDRERIGGRGVHWLAWPSGGSGQSRPTVLLHGLMDCARMWTGTARRLWPACACVAPDLRGHGGSDAVPGD